MAGVVKGMDKVLQGMDLQKVNSTVTLRSLLVPLQVACLRACVQAGVRACVCFE